MIWLLTSDFYLYKINILFSALRERSHSRSRSRSVSRSRSASGSPRRDERDDDEKMDNGHRSSPDHRD